MSRYFDQIYRLLMKKGAITWVDVVNELMVTPIYAHYLMNAFVGNDYVNKKLAENGMRLRFEYPWELGLDRCPHRMKLLALCWEDGEPLVMKLYEKEREEAAEVVKAMYWREKKMRGELLERWLGLPREGDEKKW
ncbi:hypothetical protein J7L00_03465 [Candidatus Bathyarchaeota archaeon]|nr:hypothetical protein [Candidatus Bathyarchaeota archaeon]